MINAAVSRRYAKALLGAALEVGGAELEDIARQLNDLAATIDRFNGLELLILNPAVESSKKSEVLHDVSERLGAAEIVKRFVAVLGERERLDQIEGIAAAFTRAVDEHLGIINAEITSPRTLDAGAVQDLTEKLTQTTGRTVRLRTTTDPSLLGGLRTRIGDVVYDGSLQYQLERLRDQMTES